MKFSPSSTSPTRTGSTALRCCLWNRSRVLLSVLSLASLGCSEGWYRQWADDEAYGIVEAKASELLEDEDTELDAARDFQVEQEPLSVNSVGATAMSPRFLEAPDPVVIEADIDLEAAMRTFEASRVGTTPPEGADAPDGATPPEGADAPDGAAPPDGANPPDGADAPDGANPPDGMDSTGGDRPGARPYAEMDAIEGTPEEAARILSLRECVRLALANNRDYQSRREEVYLTALALTLTRWNFAPRFFGVVTGSHDRLSNGERSGSIDTNAGFNWTWIWWSGARISVTAFNNLFQFFTGNRRESASSVLEASVSQPLLRGFRRNVVEEPLIQAERDVIYDMRSLERDRQILAIRVTSEYYRTLQSYVTVRNEYENWRSLIRSTLRVRRIADAGNIELLQVDQAEQQELQAKDRYVGAVQSYENQRDQFKITLGIAVTESIVLDPGELDLLVQRGASSLDVRATVAIETALARRLDLENDRGRVVDAERRIAVIADGLRTQFDIDGSVRVPSTDVDQRPFRFNLDDVAYGFGFTLSLPFDRKAERNAYVSQLIQHRRATRNLSLAEDNIRLTVRNAYRGLEREVIGYRIQVSSLALAEQRVDTTSELLQAGRAQTRDVLESQQALITARNALVGSLINYTLARLEFFRDTGALRVDDDGSVHELPMEGP